MLDINFIKDNKKLVKDTVKKRGIDTEKADIDAILKFEKIRREKQQELDEVNRERNLAAKARLFEKGRGLKAKAQDLGAEIRAAEKLIFKYWQWVPNVLSPKVPEGKSEDDNKEIRKWGKVPEFKFVPKSHEELGKSLEILDIERGAKVAGSGFYYFKGLGASLAWGLYNFALDYLKKQGFEQVMVPLFTREPALFGTGYFPFIGEDSYKLENEDLYAIGTSEQPLVAIHQNEVLEEANLPYQYTSFSACFRQEAGSYGKDVKGIFRVHQFHKVEQIV
ncbi:MAG: aminoacyl--tRNA ligase-related protein, partial [bacterium]